MTDVTFTQGEYVRARAYVRGLQRHCDYVVKRSNEHFVVVQSPRLPNDPPAEELECYPEDIAHAPRPYTGELWIDEFDDVLCWPSIFGPRPDALSCVNESPVAHAPQV